MLYFLSVSCREVKKIPLVLPLRGSYFAHTHKQPGEEGPEGVK